MFKLKNVKHAAFASQETHCYSASLWFGKTKVATVENAGHGGCDDVCWVCSPAQKTAALSWADKNLRQSKNPDFDALYATSTPDTLIELWCGDAVNDWLAGRDLKRLMSKRVIYTVRGKAGVFQTQCASAAQRNKWVEELSNRETTGLVLNTMPFDKAMDIFRSHT